MPVHQNPCLLDQVDQRLRSRPIACKVDRLFPIRRAPHEIEHGVLE